MTIFGLSTLIYVLYCALLSTAIQIETLCLELFSGDAMVCLVRLLHKSKQITPEGALAYSHNMDRYYLNR